VSDPVADAASAALAGALVVIPTDTVYGLATRPDDPAATARLFEAKGRPRELELPVLVASVAAGEEVASFDERARAIAVRFWAGPVTLVLPRTDRSRGWRLGGEGGTVGVRMPHHPLALAVLTRTGPLAVTSANRSGEPTPATCRELETVFAEAVDVYLCEEAPLEGRPSTVVDLSGAEPRVLREGAVSEAAILEALAAV
jgi:tRNA threonylcarbamoyl adenosine modification protein (Sua5/YciO/YrdC/YwlC family)